MAHETHIRNKRGPQGLKGDEALHWIMEHLEGEAERADAMEEKITAGATALDESKSELLRELAETKAQLAVIQEHARHLDKELEQGKKLWHGVDGAQPGKEPIRREIGLYVKELINFRRNKTTGEPRYGSELWRASQTIGVQGDGGFLMVPQQPGSVSVIMQRYGLARRKAKIFDMTKNEVDIPIGAADPVVSWPGELVAPDGTKATVARPKLTAKKAVATVDLSLESIEDTDPSILEYVADRLFISFGREEDRIFFAAKGSDGGGADPFDGCLYATGIDELVMSATNDAFENLTFEDLTFLQDEVTEHVIDAAEYVYSVSVQLLIRNLKDDNGRPLLMFDGAPNATPTRLSGFPVNLSPVMPKRSNSAASTPFLLFGDFSGMALGLRHDYRLDSDTSPLFGEAGVQLRGMQRMGVKVIHGTKIGRLKTAAS